MKKAYIVHGWGGNPEEGWFPWLKNKLEDKGFAVQVFSMPDTDNPRIESWVPYLLENIKNPDGETYLIGHSVGCQAILRYLEKLPKGVKIVKTILVAPWLELTNLEPDDISIARPWLETPIDEKKVLEHIEKIITIFSDDDPYVPAANQKIFAEKFKAEIIIEHAKGHLGGEDGIKELPVVLNRIG
jgi:hypothetical protein